MKDIDRWLLPEGIEEVLPTQARQLEALRRRLLDLYTGWGYELVMPPFIEYLESLLTGTGHDLDLETFKLTDQLTGRLMGVRADMTPQVARIDAHHLKRETPTRLCYMGTVLHTRPGGFGASRSPLQVGAELYGHAGIESDIEILGLMAETLRLCGLEQSFFDLGHVGIYRGLARQAGLSAAQEDELFDVLQRKSQPDMRELFDKWAVEKTHTDKFLALADLNGDVSVLGEAKQRLKGSAKPVLAALDYLQHMADLIDRQLDNVTLHFDLAELRGYNYHTGAVFAAFVPGQGSAVAKGGRYDDIGRVFGRARPATGFSTDLKTLLSLSRAQPAPLGGIFAPAEQDSALRDKIAALRQQGERVVCALPGQAGGAGEMGCDRQLRKRDGQWQVEPLA